MTKLDFNPDLVGVWWQRKKESTDPLEGNFSVFLMYLGRGKNSNRGTLIDNLGLAEISKYTRTPTNISFIRKDFQATPRYSPPLLGDVIIYSGGRDMNFYHGGWRKNDETGIFQLGDTKDVMEFDNPFARSFLRSETTRLRKIIEDKQREPSFLPVIPEDHT